MHPRFDISGRLFVQTSRRGADVEILYILCSEGSGFSRIPFEPLALTTFAVRQVGINFTRSARIAPSGGASMPPDDRRVRREQQRTGQNRNRFRVSRSPDAPRNRPFHHAAELLSSGSCGGLTQLQECSFRVTFHEVPPRPACGDYSLMPAGTRDGITLRAIIV